MPSDIDLYKRADEVCQTPNERRVHRNANPDDSPCSNESDAHSDPVYGRGDPTSTAPPPAVASPATGPTSTASWAEEADRLIADCGIGDWNGFVADCQTLRRQLGQPVARWSGHCLLAAVQLAVRNRGWSPARAAAALRAVAADPATRSPMRLAEAGPWWDEPAAARADSQVEAAEVAAMEADLADTGGLRIALQRQARDQLAAEGTPVTRATVTRRAHALLCARRPDDNGAAAC